MLRQTLGLICVSIFSPPRPPCTCTCLLSNQTSSSTVNTPTRWTRITLQMCSGKLLRSRESDQWENCTLNYRDCWQRSSSPFVTDLFLSNTTPSPGWLATLPPRTDALVCPFTSWCSTRCTTSSKICSELNSKRDQTAKMRYDEMRRDEMVHGLPAARNPDELGPHTRWRKHLPSSSSSSSFSSSLVYVTQHWLEVFTQPIRCQESIETFWKIKGRFIKENKLSF